MSSTSFENTRNGRRRPDDLPALVPSPSFNPHHASSRYSTVVAPNYSPLIVDGMPPTPLTAGAHNSSPSPVKLPGIAQLFGNATISPRINAARALPTPPDSSELPPSPRFDGHQGHMDDDIEQFSGPRPQWLQDTAKATFADVDRPALCRRISEKGLSSTGTSSSTTSTRRVSNRALYDVVRDETETGVTGLGLASASSIGDETPRVGSVGSNILGLLTPTQADYSRIPRITEQAPPAPSLHQEGRFESTVPTSPIHPPLKDWNTNFDFDRTMRFRAPEFTSRAAPAPASVPMQREQQVKVDWGMPVQTGVRGLGVSLDGTSDYPQASSSRSSLAEAEPTEVPINSQDSTGLTPYLGRTRISHSSSPSLKPVESPSLRSRSKKRSNLVRKEAEAAFVPDAPRRVEAGSVAAAVEGQQPEAVANKSSPKKRALSERTVNVVQQPTVHASAKPLTTAKSSKSTENASSPWGIFRVKEEGWKPLATPGGGKAPGSNAVPAGGSARKQKSSISVSLSAGQKVLASSHSHSHSHSHHDTLKVDRRSSNKENVAPLRSSPSPRPLLASSSDRDAYSGQSRMHWSSSRPGVQMTRMTQPVATTLGVGRRPLR